MSVMMVAAAVIQRRTRIAKKLRDVRVRENVPHAGEGNGGLGATYFLMLKTRVSRLCDEEKKDSTFESHEDLGAISRAWLRLLKMTKRHSSGCVQQAVEDVRLSAGVPSE